MKFFRNWLKLFRQFWKRERAWFAPSLFGLVLSLLGISYFLFLPDLPTGRFNLIPKFEEDSGNLEVEEIIETDFDCPDCQARFLDGILVPPEQARLYPIAVVLDNNPISRPQSGLSQAALVFEVPTEGGSSRFLPVFNNDIDWDEVGPVRSLRPYFIDWASDIGALLVHCGGSPESLAILSQRREVSLNEFYHGSYFIRKNNLPAPHNIMISPQSWQKFLTNQGWREAVVVSWKFKDQRTDWQELENKKGDKIEQILIRYSLNYLADWRYQEKENYYQRQSLTDKSQEIIAKNLILHFTDSQILDEQLRLRVKTIGEGEAIICLDNYCRSGYWKKNSLSDRLRYYYDNNQEVVFNPGPTWIQVITAGATFSLKEFKDDLAF